MTRKLKERESQYKNISFTLFRRNFEEIIREFQGAEHGNTLNELLGSSQGIGTGMQRFMRNGVSRFSIWKLLLWYNNRYLGYNKKILKDFLWKLSTGNIDNVAKFSQNNKGRIGYITYNFYPEKLQIFLGNHPLEVIGKELEYAGAFFYYGLLVLMLACIGITSLNKETKSLLSMLHEKITLAILTGFECQTEFQQDYPYEAVAEELMCLTSKDENKLAQTQTPEISTLEFKIKCNNIFQERYRHEGYHDNLPFFFDEEKDRKTDCTFRISKGSTLNSIIFYMKRASGQRTLGRILGFSPREVIRPNQLFDANMLAVKNLLCFSFMAIMENVSVDNLVISDFPVIDRFIKSYKGERNKADRIAVLLLVATHPELEEEIISKYFRHNKQREDFLKDLNKLKKQLKQNKESYLIKFLEDIRRSYVW